MRATRLDEASDLVPFVAAEIVEDDHIAGYERGREHALDIGAEDDAVHGTVDDERRRDAVLAQRGNEGGCLPVSVGHPADQTHAPLAPAVAARHVGLGPGLIDEDKMSWIKGGLIPAPLFAGCGHVRPVLLAGQHGFF